MATATLCSQMTAATEHVAKETGVAKDVAKERGTLPNVKTLQKREAQANRADTSIVSTPCEVTSTSKAHKMVVVMVTVEEAQRTPSEEATETQKPLAGNQNMDEDKAHAQSMTVPQHASVCKDLPKRRKVFEVLTTKSRIRWLYYWNSRRPSTNITAASRKKKRRQSSKS